MIIIDNTSSSGYEASLSTYGWSHTCGATIDILIVGVSIFAVGNVSSITYNGVNLIKIRRDAGAIYSSELWYLLNPAQGTNTVTVNLNTSLTSIAGAASYDGVSQAGPLGVNTGTTGTNNPASVVLTTSVNNVFVVDTAAIQTTSVAVGSSGTQRWNNNGLLGSGVGGDISVPASGTAQTMSWTGLGSLDAWAISAVELRPQIADDVFGVTTPGTNITVLNRMVGF